MLRLRLFRTVVRESAQSWRELLLDIKQRGLEIAPDLAVGEVHKTANVLNKVALSVQVNMKADLREIYGALTRAAAEAAIDVFPDKYGAKYDKAVACLTKDRETLLTYFDFPAEHWDHCVHQTRSRACSRRCGIEPCGQREPYRRRPPSSWCFKLVNTAAN